MVIEKLTPQEADDRLAALEGWSRDWDTIDKTYTLPSFPAALVFANAVGHLAEAADHHPDILVQYKKVSLTLSTHAAGGLTQRDFDLAAQIDALPMRG